MAYYVYILYSPTFDRYYIGQTQDLEERLRRHNAGYERATKPYVPWVLKWYAQKPDRQEAMRLEKKLKNLSKQRLVVFISKYV